jgi:serine/threonine-protein kinase
MSAIDPLEHLRPSLAERYTIERVIGRGGMATVYLARDLKHERLVALKLLDPELGAVLGADRFLAEIKVTANLQHPNLLPLFDSGEVDGLLYYVMPFVEGESLRARLDREKQLPVDEAVRIATALAAALDYAHRHGVIHRDLKPENVLLHDGQPLVADFGIALAVQRAGGQRVTQTGLSLGTPHYMSPEQATGDRAIDARTDVYALGAVTYEMLAGEPPHVGSTAQAIIARLMTEKPRALTAVRHTVPEHVDDAVRRALEKLPADRFATAKEFGDALVGRASTAGGTVATGRARTLPPPSRLRRVLASPLWFAAFFPAAVAATWGWATRAPVTSEAGRTVRFMLAPDTTGVVPSTEFAFSPDGRTVVFRGRAGGDSVERLYARPLDAVAARAIPGTEGAFVPAFSPDGQWVAFWSDGDVRKVRLDGQQLVSLARMGDGWGGISWGVQGTIVVAQAGELWTLPQGGGAPTRIPMKDTVSRAHLFPLALGDGKTVLYTEWLSSITNSTLNALSVETGEVTRLGIAGGGPLAILEGRLVYLDANGNLSTVGFDPRSRRPSGETTLLVPDVRHRAGKAEAAISGTGDLVYVGGRIATQLVVAEGDSVRALVARPNASLQFPRWSPDGRMIAVRSRLSGTLQIWIYSIEAGTFTQLTRLTGEGAAYAEWEPDGEHILYVSGRGLWSQPIGGGRATNVADITDARGFGASPDGRAIVYRTGRDESRKLWYRSLAGDTVTRPIDVGPGAQEPRLSPDGKWIAYSGGDRVVYIARFPELTNRQRISLENGRDPVWARDMGRVYYSAGDTVMAARLSRGPNLTVMRREKVIEGTYLLGRNHPGFDVSRDGRLVLVREQRENGRTIVVQGWQHELRALARKAGGRD